MFPSFVSELADNTVPGISVKHGSFAVTNTVFVGNTVAGAAGSRRYSFVIKAIDGGGAANGLVLSGNNCRRRGQSGRPARANRTEKRAQRRRSRHLHPSGQRLGHRPHSQRTGEAFSRLYIDGSGALTLGSGAIARDMPIQRTAAKVSNLGADNLLHTGAAAFPTTARPAATAAGQGARYRDTTLLKPVGSDGGTWRDAAGNAV